MACKIRILDEKTINQIAAGEVIESPASVVKELVDNAIDAGATKIVVEAVNSGRQLLRIQDNGCGMGHDDALLCIERHATSKIRSLDDLWALETMGFRGEALSSVASISEFKLLTAPFNPNCEQSEGSSLHVSGGKIVSHEKVKCLSGTTIEVRSLFFNVPARKKFLKSPAKDASDIIKVLLQAALANPKVAFELILNHKREFSWQAMLLEARIKEVLGQEFFSELLSVSYKNDGVYIHGFIANPTFSRPTRSHQYLFVNSRPISSLALSHAAKEAYGSSLDPLRHPAFVLFVDIAADALDVNVHPQKKEVRFSFEDELKKALITAVSTALFSRHAPVAKPYLSLQPSVTTVSSFSTATSASDQKPWQQPAIQYTFDLQQEPSHSINVHTVLDDFILADVSFPAETRLPDGFEQDSLYVISASRALSRLAFDGSTHNRDVAKGAVQTLLVPVFIELSVNEASQLRAIMSKLEQTGIMINDFGKASFLVQGIPNYLEYACIEEIIRKLLENETSLDDIPVRLARACKTTKFTKRLSRDAASHVVKKLLECVNPFVCPVGDKIICALTKSELEKKFR